MPFRLHHPWPSYPLRSYPLQAVSPAVHGPPRLAGPAARPFRPRLAPRALPSAARGAHPPVISPPEPAPLSHPPLYPALVPLHALAAALAIATGALALGSRKGGPRHRAAGRWYGRTIAAVAATGAALMLLGAGSVRLLVLFALTAQTTWSGVRVLRRRRPDVVAADRAGAVDWGVALAAGAVGVGACAAAAAGVESGSAAALWSTAPLLALYAGYDLWRFARPAAWPMRPRLWLGEHVVKLTGAYFGAVSAATGSARGDRVLAAVSGPWRVVVPNVIGVAVAAWFLARLRPRRGQREPSGAVAAA